MEAGGPGGGGRGAPQGVWGENPQEKPYGYHKAPGMCRQFDGKAAKA
jgi:hypothetical protein